MIEVFEKPANQPRTLMKQTKLLTTVSLVGSAVLIHFGCATSTVLPPGVSLTEADAGRTVIVPVGQTFTVQLVDNPSTGYRWEDRTAGSVLIKAGEITSVQAPAPKGMVGVPSTLAQAYQAQRSGRQNIKWVQIPPGRETPSTVLTFHITAE